MNGNHIKLTCMKEQEITNLKFLLSIPEAVVLAVGPPSCVRPLYFQALNQEQQDKLYMYIDDEKKLTMGMHLEEIKNVIEELLVDEPKILILYLSCIDLVVGSDLDNLIDDLQHNSNTYLIQFKRGPLEKRKIMPKTRIKIILSELINKDTFSVEQRRTVEGIVKELNNEQLFA